MVEYAFAHTNATDTTQRVRLALSGLLPATAGLRSRTGMLDAGGQVTLAGGMGVTVTAFRAYIQGVSAATQGGYLVVCDTDKTLTVEDGGAAARVDLVVARVYDNAIDGSGATKAVVELVKGSPGVTPVTPDSAIRLAEVAVPAGVSAGTGGLTTAPTDRRPLRLGASGGITPVANAADRDTLAKYPGMTVWRNDTNTLEVCTTDGTWKAARVFNDVPTTNIPLAAGAGTLRYRVNDGIFYFRANITGLAVPTSAWFTLAAAGAVPAAYRPLDITRFGAMIGSFLGVISFETDGSVRCLHQGGANQSSVYAAGSYPVGM